MKRTLVAAMMTLTLAGTSAAVSANDWQDTAKDAWIVGKAETTLLLNSNLNSFKINTNVEDGNVILTGQVATEVDKALAGELVENLEGVKSVDNQLTVMPADRARSDDEQDSNRLTDAKIATVVKTRLLLESEVSGTAIKVDVSNGVVTLQGEVDSASERDLAEALAKKSKDVTRVDNQLRVASS
ncbi:MULTISPECIES: BON domain-containing protein [Alkalimonas]|uniref:BON domain-containing protein n=1 Tax=Alkalimonas mucilaginosa TaxID=3057676 RepID=A0ABU7JB38_9GAMM|nr:BON domain-containing protein [Alkalimonas sp. MEB004]MEE2022807.1 BON domain-containing protein [Alkalimonas sp. MEB004]